MRPLLLALLLTLGSFAAYGQAPDCQFTQTFTATGYGLTVSNQAVANLGTQCTTWRLSYYADGMSALSIQIEGAPDSSGSPGTFAAVPTTACSSTVQPPCTLDGTNPLTDPNHATEAFRGYYAWMALDVTVFTPTGASGTITARMYGYKGTSSASRIQGGGGGGSGITALTGDVTATGPGSAAATVVAINGGSVPASAHVLGTDGSSQPVVATATDLSAIMYGAGGGIAQKQTVALSPAITALTNGLTVCWLPVAANTAAAPTLAVDATPSQPITKLGTTALVANDLTTTAVACVINDGTEFQLQNPQTVSSGGSFVPYSGATGDVALGVHGITGAPFTGDSGSGGTTGLVPAPAAGDAVAGKYLSAGGGYAVPPGTGGAANYQTVDNAGTPLTQRPALNFTGSGVSCADNSGATRTDCTITGGGASGTPGATVFSSTTTTGPSNSAAETSVIGTVTGSKTIAANVFTDGAVLQAHAQGFFSLPAISDSLTLKMKCGSTVIGSAVLTPGVGVLSNGSWRFWLDIAARGTGAGGAFITNGIVELTGSALTDTTAQVLNTITVAYDFTTACVFDVTAQWGAAQVGETIQGTNVATWFPGAPVTSVYGLTGAISPTAHNESAPLTCAAASSSATAYTCSTSPTFTPAANDCVLLVADVASGSSPTLAVNSASALAITKQQNASTLIANDLLAGGRVLVCMDAASHWQMQGQTGNAASGGGLSYKQELVLAHNAPSAAPNTLSTAIDGGSSSAELQTSPGYYLYLQVAGLIH